MPRLFSILAFATGICILTPASGAAQTRATPVQPHTGRSLDDLPNGARIRIAVQGEDPTSRLEARLQGFGETTLMVNVDGARRDLPLTSVLWVEESYRDRKRGALAGMVVAAIGVYAWDFFGNHPRYRDQTKRYKENAAALVVSVPVGALVGAAIGWHRWRQIDIR